MICGADGFIGRYVKDVLLENNTVASTTRKGGNQKNDYAVDLLDKESINRAIKKFSPNVVINCAGIVGGAEKNELNEMFTSNLLDSILSLDLKLKRIIIIGSAAEYGEVLHLPVGEDDPKNPKSPYAISKANEVKIALNYRQKYNLPVVVARVFNPIGKGMKDKFLIPQLVRQVKEFRQGKRKCIELSRLDSVRDYVSIKDVASAIRMLVEAEPRHSVYNIGSGVGTTNGELLKMVISNSRLDTSPDIIETSHDPEPKVASQADISRMTEEFNWSPKHTLESTIREIINDNR